MVNDNFMKEFVLVFQTMEKKISGIGGVDSHVIIRDDKKNNEKYKAYVEILLNQHKGIDLFNSNIDFDYLELKKKAKIMDFYTYDNALSSAKYIVSEKAKNLLSKFNLPKHKFILVNLYQNEEKLEGYYLFLVDFYEIKDGDIDFNKTKFYIQQGLGTEKTYVKLDKFKDYKIWKSENWSYSKCEMLYFTSQFPKYDIFLSREWPMNYSKELAGAIKEAGLLGLEFYSKDEGRASLVVED